VDLAPFCRSMTWQKATARFMGSGRRREILGEALLASAFQQPMIFAASSTLSWLFSSFSRFWRRG
jgi:hypothetical protein